MGATNAGQAPEQGPNPRIAMGTDALTGIVNLSASATSHGINHPRYSQPAMDPAFFPVARPRPSMASTENGGARFRLVVGIPILTMPEAGPTQKNGRVITAKGRSGSFWEG